MKKLLALWIMFLVVAFASPSFASVGVKVDNNPLGSAADLRFNSSGTAGVNKSMSFDGSQLTFNLFLAGSGTSGAVSLGTGDQDVDRGYSLTYKEIGATGEVGKLHNGLPGELITIRITAAQTNGNWRLTSATSITWSYIKFTAKGQSASFLYISDTVGWILFGDTDAVFAPLAF